MKLALIAALLVPQEAAEPPAQELPPEVLWDFTSETTRFDDVVVGGGRAFALDRAGMVHGVDAEEGDPLWSTAVDGTFSRLFGIAYCEREGFAAVIVTNDAGVAALDPRTGEPLWVTPVKAGLAGPACGPETIVAGGGDGSIHGFSLRTGEHLWATDVLGDAPPDPPGFSGQNARFDDPARPSGAAVEGDLAVVALFDQCRAVAVDARTGERRWSFRTQGWMRPTPEIHGDTVFLGSQDRHLYAVDRNTGAQRWKFATGSRISGAALAAEGRVYFGSCDTFVYALDAASGELAWKHAVEDHEGRTSAIYGRPVLHDRTLCIATLGGDLYGLDAGSGDRRWATEPLAGSDINSDLQLAEGRIVMSTRKRSEESGESVVLAVGLP